VISSEDSNAVVVGAEGEDLFPRLAHTTAPSSLRFGSARVGGEMGVVSGLDEAVENVDDVVVLFRADVKVESVALGVKYKDTW
jgi:hypothetical protein